MLIKLLNYTIIEPELYKAHLIMNSDSTTTMKIIKILEFK